MQGWSWLVMANHQGTPRLLSRMSGETSSPGLAHRLTPSSHRRLLRRACSSSAGGSTTRVQGQQGLCRLSRGPFGKLAPLLVHSARLSIGSRERAGDQSERSRTAAPLIRPEVCRTRNASFPHVFKSVIFSSRLIIPRYYDLWVLLPAQSSTRLVPGE